MGEHFSKTAALIWSVADLLRGDFKQSQYGRIILPFTLLRRLECVLEPTKDDVIAKYETIKAMPHEAQEKILAVSAKQSFYNTSKMDLTKLGETSVAQNLESYVQSFSSNAREIFEHFDFFNTIDKLSEADLLYKVAKRFATTDLHPEVIDNYHMGLTFEELIRRFAESSNETAGEHFTPRDIVRLTTSLVFCHDDDLLTKQGLVRSIYDPTAGTGGFLSSGMEYVHELNDKAALSAFGQELNPESYAICKADMLIKGQKVDNIKLGNTLSDDHLPADKFDYMLSNPPFGVDWKKVQKKINDEHKFKGFKGRFGAGLPRVSDGSLLFLMHLVSKMRPKHEGGSRIGIILNGSPLFTGGAGSGESEIRRYLLEHDLVEAIIALPTDMFYNTGIATYVWILTNSKPEGREKQVQLINASVDDKEAPDNNFYVAMRKSLGSKRRELPESKIDEIVKLYGQFEQAKNSKIFNYQEFGYRRITVERPLQLAFDVTEDKLHAYLSDHHEKLKKKAPELSLEEVKESHPPSGYQTLQRLIGQPIIMSRNEFLAQFNEKLSAAEVKTLCKYFGEHNDEAEICYVESGKNKGQPEPNPDLRDNENVPLTESVQSYFEREVLPHVPNAWIDESKRDEKDGEVGIVGYEIPFNRHFYEYKPPRKLEEIDKDLDIVSGEIMQLLQEVHS
ncbi:type I restriction-modification system subunit M [Alteromonas macleodii]|uniref:site-specific DNA-methyltransferase (adenine-specific) n=1 Tax=Alteromonas macleodii TaxID=28108 RepID=A0A6T9YAF7_ALTMA|nr:class I SAM-dependent DNA methyltransferase [Alteromonas macleodii]CAB9495343.1 Restriction endonuclease subunit M [Alteromonas macleodii]